MCLKTGWWPVLMELTEERGQLWDSGLGSGMAGSHRAVLPTGTMSAVTVSEVGASGGSEHSGYLVGPIS